MGHLGLMAQTQWRNTLRSMQSQLQEEKELRRFTPHPQHPPDLFTNVRRWGALVREAVTYAYDPPLQYGDGIRRHCKALNSSISGALKLQTEEIGGRYWGLWGSISAATCLSLRPVHSTAFLLPFHIPSPDPEPGLEASRRPTHKPSVGSVPHPRLSQNCQHTSTMPVPPHSLPLGLPFLPTRDQLLPSCCLPSWATSAFPQ